MNILLIADIHANFPALAAIDTHFVDRPFDAVINAGDSVVYGPFPNETLDWLRGRKTASILGNTDKKILKLVAGQSFKKPSKYEKRIMYTWTAEVINGANADYLRSFPTSLHLEMKPGEGAGHHLSFLIGVFHGSPMDDDEFLFPDTPGEHLLRLARYTPAQIVITGHSHTPFHLLAGDTHFINPGSAGRMFDGDPRASCAVLSLTADGIQVEHFRIPYPIHEVTAGLTANHLPEIYNKMFLLGKKLN